MKRRFANGVLVLALATAASADEPAKKVPYVEPPLIRSLSFSPDGSLLAAGLAYRGRGTVIVWETASHKRLCQSQAGESPVVGFSEDGGWIAVAEGRKNLLVIDPTSGKKIGEFGPFASEVTTLLPAGAGKWITLGKDQVIRVWDEKEKKVAHEFTGYKRVAAWAVSPNKKWFFASGDGADRVWDLASGDELKGLFKARPGTVNVAAFLRDERIVLGSNMGSHRIVELPSGKDLLRFKNEGGTGAIAYSPAAEMLAGRYYSSMTVALTPLTLRSPTEQEKGTVDSLLRRCDSDDDATREKAAAELLELGPAIEPLLRQAMTKGPSAEVRMRARLARDAILNKPKFTLTGHQDEVRTMAFTPDGKLLATGGADGLVILWDPASGKEVGRFGAE